MTAPRWPAVLVLAATLAAGCTDDGTDGAGPTTTAGGSASTSPASTAASDGNTTVQIFFLDEDAFNIGRPPYVTPVERQVDVATRESGALDALFAGPTPDERAGGLRFVASEATGYADLRIDDGTAHVRLAGGCASGGSTFTVADEILPTLTQFTDVHAVKIYDPEGDTAAPDEPGDSIPSCLEP